MKKNKSSDRKRRRRIRRFWRAVGVVVENLTYAVAGLGIACFTVLAVEMIAECENSRLMVSFFLSWMLLCCFIDYMKSTHFCRKRVVRKERKKHEEQSI